jgi:ferric-dicitrate binding protein FerR (iron transport regulator)
MFDSDKAWDNITQLISEEKKIIPLHQRIFRYAAVILPFLILAYGAFYFLNDVEESQEQIVAEKIEPGTEKATLVLEDGTSIDLESVDAPNEIMWGEVKIDNNFSMLKYPELSSSETPVYHELRTPRGGKYGIVLPDGSEVLLNAGTTLRYPTAFNGDKREVFLDGEAYLQVEKDEKPFIVNSGDLLIRVLGTTFNVEAYQDESIQRTTLIEGKVRVIASGALTDEILLPNEQAVLNLEDQSFGKRSVIVRQFTSWINGKFEFENDNLETVMKKLSRWYDFDYQFKDPQAKNYHFSARIDDKQDISTILDMLEMTTSVKFEIRDKTILIL